ncbi:hypothetical protein GCM10010289_39610 [Streptomyces violascens]|uniref:Uncharacterized protein n=1 Tax=Streptomyces violascens TaxID=67381 RepID=A0ABQ3QXL9_9ACTN|nr:hypothetical protein GCM10010289_39610 [Streptomyces violascens]GHI42010.1 hypothetical protein Sviol_64180 [Streptomyces violascens]
MDGASRRGHSGRCRNWPAAVADLAASRAGLGRSPGFRLEGLAGPRVACHQVRWTRVVSLDTHLANIGSRSAFLTEERHRLREALPGDAVEETYLAGLLVAARP